jgi:hypothetical protein
MNSIERAAYHAELVDWLSAADWLGFITLTHKIHRPADWFFTRMDRLGSLLSSNHGIGFEWAASIEKTKNGVNHLHAPFRCPGYTGELLKAGSKVFPTDWIKRQHAPAHKLSRVVNAIHRVSNTGVEGFDAQSSKEGLQKLRNTHLQLYDYIGFWYQGNYGCMADTASIRSQEGVVSYALKYAMKDIDQPKLTWMVSKRAIPVIGLH